MLMNFELILLTILAEEQALAVWLQSLVVRAFPNRDM
jgi:hypothetical protein